MLQGGSLIEEKEYSYETSRSASAALIFFGMFVLIFGPVWAINNDTGITVFILSLILEMQQYFIGCTSL